MPRKKRNPTEAIPDSREVRETKSAINGLLSEIVRLATGTSTSGHDLITSDQRRVLSWLAGQLTFSSNGHREAAGVPFVAEVARHRYHAIASGLRAGLTIERVAAEAGVSPSAITQVQIRHQATFDSDPARRAVARQRRIDAARRAAERRQIAHEQER